MTTRELEKETARADVFKALGDPTRLRIFDFLRSCCCPVAVEEGGDVRPVDGPTVGEVCCRVTGAERINSTISHHLKELRLAGLISRGAARQEYDLRRQSGRRGRAGGLSHRTGERRIQR